MPESPEPRCEELNSPATPCLEPAERQHAETSVETPAEAPLKPDSKAIEEERDLECGPELAAQQTNGTNSSASNEDIARHDHYVATKPRPRRWVQWMKACNVFLFTNGFGVLFCIPLLIPLVLIAQPRTTAMEVCAPREVGCGFEGDEDAYGLGIRLGIYLQWISWYLVTEFLVSEERSLIITMTAFDTAVLIAILVGTFDTRCTYAIEIIIMLFIIFTTVMLTTLTKSSLDLVQRIQREEENELENGTRSQAGSWSRLVRANSFIVSPTQSKRKHGFTAATSIVGLLTLTYSAWFWVRMAAWPDDTFAQTPCGTTIFFLGPVRTPLSITAISAITATAIISLMVAAPMEMVLKKWLSVKTVDLIMMCWLLPIVLPFALTGGLVSTMVAFVRYFYIGFRKADSDPDWEPDTDEVAEKWVSHTFSITGVAIIAVSIVGIELSLSWNGVKAVYSVASTGQLIPLCVGLVSFLPLFWKLGRTRLADPQARNASEPEKQD